MTQEEAITVFFEKKQTEGLSNSAIRAALKSDYNFSDDTVKEILMEISDRELIALKSKKGSSLAFLESKYVSYFFILFGIIAIIVSIFYTQKEAEDDLHRFFPWFMILGALFIIYKHIYRLFKQ